MTKAKLLTVSEDRREGGCEAGLMMEGVEWKKKAVGGGTGQMEEEKSEKLEGGMGDRKRGKEENVRERRQRLQEVQSEG